MRRRLLLPLIAAVALALAGLSLGVLAADAATTPTASANYEYDHPAAFVRGSEGSTPRPATSPASLTAGAERALPPIGFAARIGVAAEDVPQVLANQAAGNAARDAIAARYAGARTEVTLESGPVASMF